MELKMRKAIRVGLTNVRQELAERLYLTSGLDITKPVQVYCLLTYRCNARCKMCDHWRLEHYPEELPASVWIEALRDLKRFSPGAHVQFTGGEVLMKNDFLDILKWCGQNGLSAGMVTNAGMITREIAEKIVDCRPNNVNISVDSPFHAVHDELRGREGFLKKVIAGIGFLRDASEKAGVRIAISVKPTMSKLNFESMPELLEKAVSWGATMMNIQPLVVRTDETVGMDIAGLDGVEEVFTRLLDMKRAGYPLVNTKRQFDSWNKIGTVQSRRRKPCTVGLRLLEILSDGDVQFCNHILTRIGNIRESKISELWYSPQAKIEREKTVLCRYNCTASCYVSRTFAEKVVFFWRSFVDKKRRH